MEEEITIYNYSSPEEVDSSFFDEENYQTKGEYINQIKGKANRLPGFKSKGETDNVVFPDEVIFFYNLLIDLNTDPRSVDELKDQIGIMEEKGFLFKR